MWTQSCAALLSLAVWAAPKPKAAAARELWEMSLDGGRSLTWERSFKSESEVKPNRGFWNKLVDVVAGAPDYRFLVRPYSITSDSRGRLIVTDPGRIAVFISSILRNASTSSSSAGKKARMR